MTTTPSSIDTVFELIKNRRRRYVLYYLDRTTEPAVTLDELTAQLVDWEQTWGDGAELPPEELRTRVRVSLHHNHLPYIADEGLVEYDAESQTVRDWDSPSVVKWARESQDELPLLRALACASPTR